MFSLFLKKFLLVHVCMSVRTYFNKKDKIICNQSTTKRKRIRKVHIHMYRMQRYQENFWHNANEFNGTQTLHILCLHQIGFHCTYILDQINLNYQNSDITFNEKYTQHKESASMLL